MKISNPKYKLLDSFFLWAPFVSWALLIFLFSARPTKTVSEVYIEDFIAKKLAHILEYGFFATLLYRALIGQGVKKKKAGLYSIVFSVIYGATDEFHQSFIPGREPAIRDVIFDTIGATLAIYTIWKLLPKAPKKLRNWAKELQIT